jgi:hypothetical protein
MTTLQQKTDLDDFLDGWVQRAVQDMNDRANAETEFWLDEYIHLDGGLYQHLDEPNTYALRTLLDYDEEIYEGEDLTDEEKDADYLKYQLINHYWDKTSADEDRALELEGMNVEVSVLNRDHHWSLYRIAFS